MKSDDKRDLIRSGVAVVLAIAACVVLAWVFSYVDDADKRITRLEERVKRMENDRAKTSTVHRIIAPIGGALLNKGIIDEPIELLWNDE